MKFIENDPISPVNLSKVLYIKGFNDFHPSLELSRHLSHIPPLNSPTGWM